MPNTITARITQDADGAYLAMMTPEDMARIGLAGTLSAFSLEQMWANLVSLSGQHRVDEVEMILRASIVQVDDRTFQPPPIYSEIGGIVDG